MAPNIIITRMKETSRILCSTGLDNPMIIKNNADVTNPINPPMKAPIAADTSDPYNADNSISLNHMKLLENERNYRCV